ncbi:MAG: serine/threonine-protein kinase, partial [Actinomycetota bacterium]
MSPARRGSGEEPGTPKRKTPARKKPTAPRKAAGRKPSAPRKRAAPGAFTEPAVGSTIGSYLIEAPLGRGGMGVLFRAADQRPATKGRRVALKVLSPSLAADDRFRRRFERESQMAASLDHPNIVPVFEAGEDAGVLYIAMRYVEGEDLHAYLARTGPLDPAAAIALLSQIGAALDAAHEHALVHRDVKPANILVVGSDGPGAPHVYLTDFGVTKHTTSRSGLTATGQFVGTVEYVAPEQIEGRELDGRADVYSLGCVMFECITGSPPFARERDAATMWAHLSEPPPSATAKRPDLPKAIDAVIERALAKSPDDRYGTCGEMMDAAR